MTCRPLFAVALACFVGCFGVKSAHAAVPTTTLSSVVKLQVHNDRWNVLGSGAGVIIDADGRILTSYQAVKAWEPFKKQPVTVCPTIDPYSEPRCTMRAVVLKTSPAHDLALLQIQSMYYGDDWMTIEERLLRQSFALPFSRIHATATTESVDLGEELALVGYPSTGGATLTYTKSSVTGFQRRAQKTTTLPWLIKTETKFTNMNIGGAAFTLDGDFVGMPTHASGTKESLGHVISLPVINTFLKEALGNDYVLGKTPLRLREPLVGVQNGVLKASVCPEFANVDGNSKTCRCRTGFFAVGNTCIVGQVYCPLRFPGSGTYDGFLKQCLCPTTNGGSETCAMPKPATKPNASTPKPTAETACNATKHATWSTAKKSCDCTNGYHWNKNATLCEANPKPIAPPSCPALAAYNAAVNACVCTKPYTLNTKKDTCIFVGKPSTITQLQRCEFIGKYANKRYYPKGHSIIKQMTYVGKQCFATEADAQKATFKRTTTK